MCRVGRNIQRSFVAYVHCIGHIKSADEYIAGYWSAEKNSEYLLTPEPVKKVNEIYFNLK